VSLTLLLLPPHLRSYQFPFPSSTFNPVSTARPVCPYIKYYFGLRRRKTRRREKVRAKGESWFSDFHSRFNLKSFLEDKEFKASIHFHHQTACRKRKQNFFFCLVGVFFQNPHHDEEKKNPVHFLLHHRWWCCGYISLPIGWIF